jgi:hypothetical protein
METYQMNLSFVYDFFVMFAVHASANNPIGGLTLADSIVMPFDHGYRESSDVAGLEGTQTQPFPVDPAETPEKLSLRSRTNRALRRATVFALREPLPCRGNGLRA